MCSISTSTWTLPEYRCYVMCPYGILRRELYPSFVHLLRGHGLVAGLHRQEVLPLLKGLLDFVEDGRVYYATSHQSKPRRVFLVNVHPARGGGGGFRSGTVSDQGGKIRRAIRQGANSRLFFDWMAGGGLRCEGRQALEGREHGLPGLVDPTFGSSSTLSKPSVGSPPSSWGVRSDPPPRPNRVSRRDCPSPDGNPQQKEDREYPSPPRGSL